MAVWEHDSLQRVQGLTGAAELGRATAVSLTAAALVRAAARPRHVETEVGQLGAARDTLADGVWMAMASPLRRRWMDRGCSGVEVRERNVLISTKGQTSAPAQYGAPYWHGKNEGESGKGNLPHRVLLGRAVILSSLLLQEVHCTAQPDERKVEHVAGTQHSRWLDPGTGLPYTRVKRVPSWLDKNGARCDASESSSWLDPINGVRRSGNDQV